MGEAKINSNNRIKKKDSMIFSFNFTFLKK